MTKPIEAILAREVTRQEFLVTAGMAVASIFGFSTLVRLLTGHSLTHRGVSAGYGHSAYGGGKD
ncbi:MAG TPA: hypothetical protein VHB51_00640 [Candidatus Saccharimonadales bacterium]|nr:hypothetical protein [Candidatus Saccharimonadales bacterium]